MLDVADELVAFAGNGPNRLLASKNTRMARAAFGKREHRTPSGSEARGTVITLRTLLPLGSLGSRCVEWSSATHPRAAEDCCSQPL